jgi:hypothetical protein
MLSKEIWEMRRVIEKEYREKANLTTGVLDNSRVDFEEKMFNLQNKCSHIWDNGEYATQYIAGSGLKICTICMKKTKQ